MATRSDTIAKARKRLIQGDSDPMWDDEEMNDFYHDAIDIISTAVCDADLPYYMVDVTIAKGATGAYPIPEDFRTLKRVRDSSDNQDIYPERDPDHDDDNAYKMENGTLVLVNWSGDLPASLRVNYQRFQPDLGEWDGSDDPTTTVPEAPLNSSRGSRLIASVMVALAKIKDEDLTGEQARIMESLIDRFVDRIGSIDDVVPENIGE